MPHRVEQLEHGHGEATQDGHIPIVDGDRQCRTRPATEGQPTTSLRMSNCQPRPFVTVE
jgi:hypothetical protein